MQRSLIPFIFLGLGLPTWPIHKPERIKLHPQELPVAALELIQGIGPVMAKQLVQHKNWHQQKGIGPKTYKKLSKVLSH
jgi:predicted flap endonuclease-1-like 5' DNA nuclease